MHILHINLARGFRGGERQTALLINGISARAPAVQQSLIVRNDSPLPDYLEHTDQLRIIRISRPYLGYLWRPQKSIDLIHAHEAKACHLSFLLSKRTGTPYLMTRRMDRAPKNDWFTRQVYQHCAHAVCLSSAIATIIRQAYPSIETSIIPSMKASLAHSPEQTKAIKSRYPGKVLIGHIGALVAKHKGQDYLIEAARSLANTHPHLHFLLIGEGKDRDQLEQQAQGLGNVEFVGFQQAVGDYLRALDLFVFPSLEEGLGSTLLDAMEAELPIIASRAGGIPDIIRHRHNGLLVPAKDAPALVDAITRLLEDNQWASQLAQQGKADVQEYSPELISARYLNLYNALLNPAQKH